MTYKGGPEPGDGDPDPFWALRGGRDNFGVVTGLEINLVPVAQLYGGGLFTRPISALPRTPPPEAAWPR